MVEAVGEQFDLFFEQAEQSFELLDAVLLLDLELSDDLLLEVEPEPLEVLLL